MGAAPRYARRLCTARAGYRYHPPFIPDAERERQGQVALFLLRMHIRSGARGGRT